MLKQKADTTLVQSLQTKFGTSIDKLELNVQMMDSDLKQFSTFARKLYVNIQELQEANKDILVGKRKLDCLSCGEADYHTATHTSLPENNKSIVKSTRTLMQVQSNNISQDSNSYADIRLTANHIKKQRFKSRDDSLSFSCKQHPGTGIRPKLPFGFMV